MRSTWVIMNRETRRLSKIPDEVKNEVQPFYLNRTAIPTQNTDTEKIDKLTDRTAHTIRTGLAVSSFIIYIYIYLHYFTRSFQLHR